MAARVDVCDSSPEAPFLREHLRQAGFVVRDIELDEVPRTRADLLILAGDAPSALSRLRDLRDDDDRGGVPVVLVGIPEGREHPGDGPGFGAEAVFLRPVELAPFLVRVRALLSTEGEVSQIQAPRVERTMQLSDPTDPDSSQVLLREDEPPPVFAPREPTMQLDGPSSTDSGEVSQVTTGRSQVDVPADTSGGDSSPGSRASTAARVIPPEERAELSPWLAELLSAADRRVFPDREPLALHFPAADESPEELVPRDLFDALRLDEPAVEDPIDAFTYVGGPAVPPPVQSPTSDDALTDPGSGRSVAPPGSTRADGRRTRQEQTTATEAPSEAPGSGVHPAVMVPPSSPGGEWPEDDTVLGRADAEGGRRGGLGPGGAIRLLWRVASLRIDAICELRFDDGRAARLTFLGGELRAFDGGVATRALEELRRRGRAAEQPLDEAGAERVLLRRVEVGELGRFERDRLMREARESLLAEIVAAPRADFTLLRLEDTQPGRALARSRVLSRSLRAALVDAARVALPHERAIELLGGLSVGVGLGVLRENGLAAAELTSELVDLFTRLEGRPLRDLLAEAPTELGLAGLVYALVAGDALSLGKATEESRDPEARRAVQRMVAVAAELAEDGDYFSILGVPPDAGGPEISKAYEARRGELLALPLELLGLDTLASRRDEAVEALAEAYDAIGDAARRRAYARALGL